MEDIGYGAEDQRTGDETVPFLRLRMTQSDERVPLISRIDWQLFVRSFLVSLEKAPFSLARPGQQVWQLNQMAPRDQLYRR